jgi:hypothetical protein
MRVELEKARNPRLRLEDVAPIARVRGACREHGTPMGIGCASLEQAREVIQPGDQLLLVGSNDLAVASEARRTVAALGAPLAAPNAP